MKYLQFELQHELKQIHHVREYSTLGTIQQSQLDKLSLYRDWCEHTRRSQSTLSVGFQFQLGVKKQFEKAFLFIKLMCLWKFMLKLQI